MSSSSLWLLAKAARARERADMRDKAKGGILETVRAGGRIIGHPQVIFTIFDRASISSLDL